MHSPVDAVKQIPEDLARLSSDTLSYTANGFDSEDERILDTLIVTPGPGAVDTRDEAYTQLSLDGDITSAPIEAEPESITGFEKMVHYVKSTISQQPSLKDMGEMEALRTSSTPMPTTLTRNVPNSEVMCGCPIQ